ncbi:restriction endonuclease subunit S [Legionella pneumophila serogroup 1]
MSNTQEKYWFGKAPSHWNAVRVKSLFRLACESSKDNHGMELLSVYTDIGVKPRKELEQKGNKASTTDGYWIVRKGDLVVNKLLAWMGAVGYSEYDGVTSPAYDILRARTPSINPKFYHYLFRLKLTQGEFRRWSKGIMDMRLRLYFSELGNVFIPCPPLSEQNAIVEFIDNETARIDQLIEKKKQLINLLNEKRNSLVYEKVNTINQNVLRFSRKKFPSKFITDNFPQTKELPFDVIRLGLVTRIFSGGTPDKSNLSFWLNGHIPWIGSGEVNQFKVTKPTAYITSAAVANSSTKLMPKGSIIMALAGQGKTKAMVAQMGIDAYGNQSLACIDGYNGNNRFLLWWLKSLYLQIRALSSQETRDGLNQSILGQLPAPILNKQIQISIADFLDKENEKIDQLIRQVSASIELLRLFKSSLITEAVTGQLDIKAWEKRGRTDERLDNIQEAMRT